MTRISLLGPLLARMLSFSSSWTEEWRQQRGQTRACDERTWQRRTHQAAEPLQRAWQTSGGRDAEEHVLLRVHEDVLRARQQVRGVSAARPATPTGVACLDSASLVQRAVKYCEQRLSQVDNSTQRQR